MGRRLRSPELRNVVEVTMRTFQERLFLRPSAALNEVVLGALGRAQARYGLVIHQFVALSNHYHMLCSPTDPQQLARFMNFFNSKLAREIARLHNWRGRIWAGPYSAIRVSDEALAQVARCKYLLAQGCKEGFVATPGDWPGVNTVDALRYDTVLQGVWHDRTKEYNARRVCRSVASADFRSTEIVHLTPLPC